MKKSLWIFICLIAVSCQADKYKVNHYFDTAQQDTLLTNIVTYIYSKAPQSTNQTRFQPRFRNFYVAALPKFSIENYYIGPDSTHYFFVIRPVGNLPYKRGVIGRYKLGKNLMPTNFEEVVNTPHLDEKLVKERGRFLFKELIKTGNLNKYLTMKHYVEWPDAHLVYDKKLNEWVAPTSESIQ
ncbi:hypothetical protein [Emticicia fluvialis]|uniref:hypothetical protein n=1 Tax=Emticicia fluvialis TaxID=2974474 RepID=UPI002165E2DB|nr:hypothetical protein [Emticicia fluvialis]